jgi:A/G-specific adenine glycosylase
LTRLWSVAEERLPPRGIEPYTQAMMDIGAGICVARNPQCLICPVNADCVARLENRIAELPGRKRRAAGKRRRIAMLVVLSHGEVLLEKRPGAGIWGGLWSLPEADVADEPRAALERDWGLHAASAEAMQPFEHAFTHFTLEVEPWRMKLAKATRLAEGRAGTWMPLCDLAGAALPSPVRKLLRQVELDG